MVVLGRLKRIDSQFFGVRIDLRIFRNDWQWKQEAGIQSWPNKFVLGCVIPPAGAVARSRNLGQTFLANSVHIWGIARTSFNHRLAEHHHGPLIVAAQPRAGLDSLGGRGGLGFLLRQGLQLGGLSGPNFVLDDVAVAVAVLLLQPEVLALKHGRRILRHCWDIFIVSTVPFAGVASPPVQCSNTGLKI